MSTNRLIQFFTGGVKAMLFAIVSLLVIIILIVVWINHTTHAHLVDSHGVEISATVIDEVRAIGEWDFMSVSDEEIVDTTRNGFFGDDHLSRIYYGTLRLGIDTRELGERWLSIRGDTVVATLPQVKLLDERFIDEARTKTFFESGEWNAATRDALYMRAKEKMRNRCMNASNIKSAEQNAALQFDSMLRALGFNYIRVVFDKRKH